MQSGDVDLRVAPVEHVLDLVEHGLRVRLDTDSVVRKRRSVGARTSRGTWVRIERRSLHRIDGQGWNGVESAAVLTGIAKPEWFAGMAWRETVTDAMWRVDETELVVASPVKAGGRLVVDPGLPDAWWSTLNASLDALAGQDTTRVATPDTVTVTPAVVTESIRATFGDGIDTTLTEWVPAHADLNWANVTGPQCWILDWEDWGLAPRGLDAATLWGNSLAVPDLAERVRRERHADLESRSGRLMALFFCAKVMGRSNDPTDPLVGPARRESVRLVGELRLSR
ncbi:hypothetical protein B4N89_45590 [Embleya scabrispora]|uniref:Aminoglycoside phosphotransferase n=1 Tax=Embleya scabrispora TaxID=159449 RepID=A0A1T3NIT8_9ACTN|nr:hypothetical protein [Embleya scabrispora]OPC76757.1 hypothetical protein B4N89_45590 [Embleya scabrispora]